MENLSLFVERWDMNKYLYLILLLFIFLVNSLVNAENDRMIIYPLDIHASSYLLNDGYSVKTNYHPYYVLDGNPTTAWVEGSSGDGIGEYLELFFEETLDNLVYLKVRNGYQKSDTLYLANNRVKELKVELIYKGSVNQEFRFTLEDKAGWQEFKLNVTRKFDRLRLIIDDIYSGTKYHDTCISDLLIETSHSDSVTLKSQTEIKSGYDRWFANRKKEEQFFLKLPKNYPFKHYKKLSFSQTLTNLPNQPMKFNWDLVTNLFKETKWRDYVNSHEGKMARSIFNTKIDTWKPVKLTYIGNETYTPDMLMEMGVDISKYVELKQFDIDYKNTKKKPESELFEVGLSANKIIIITNTQIVGDTINIEDGNSIIIDRYYYNFEGRLSFIDANTNYEDAELFNFIFLSWHEGKISEIFYVTANETGDGNVIVKLSIYQ